MFEYNAGCVGGDIQMPNIPNASPFPLSSRCKRWSGGVLFVRYHHASAIRRYFEHPGGEDRGKLT